MTLKEIAALTGVSVSTVSRVINGQDPKCASPEVHNKIWAAVRNFGYSPNPFAKNLKRNGASKQANPFHDAIVYCCSRQLPQVGYQDWELLARIETEILRNRFAANPLSAEQPLNGGEIRGQGIVLLGEESEGRTAQYLEKFKNLVCIAKRPSRQLCDLVLMDPEKPLRGAWAYLRELGHSRIALAGNRRGVLSRYYEETLSGAAGQELFFPCGLSMSDGFLVAEALLRGPEFPTALICENSSIAFGVIQALGERHLSVPEQLSVLSLGGGLNHAHMAFPAGITTFSYNKGEIAYLAVDLLVDRVRRSHLSPVIYEPECRMVEGGSCAAPGRR